MCPPFTENRICNELCLVNGIKCKVGPDHGGGRPVTAEGYKVGRVMANIVDVQLHGYWKMAVVHALQKNLLR